jgi:hypothetical protein
MNLAFYKLHFVERREIIIYIENTQGPRNWTDAARTLRSQLNGGEVSSDLKKG